MTPTHVTETFDILAHARQVRRKQGYRRYATLGAGLSLLAASLSARLPLRPLIAVVGASLLARGITGDTLRASARRLREGLGGRKRWRFDDSELDLVDEASWESFPASDPPGYAPR